MKALLHSAKALDWPVNQPISFQREGFLSLREGQRDQPTTSPTGIPAPCCHLIVPTTPRVEKDRKGQAEGDAWGREVGRRVKAAGLRPGRRKTHTRSEDLCARATGEP